MFANASWDLSSRTSVGVDLIAADVEEALPGSLTRAELDADPRQADPVNVADDWGRFYQYGRLALTLEHRLGDRQKLSASAHVQDRSVDHPIFLVLDQQGTNAGAEVRYEYERDRYGLVVGFAPFLGNGSEHRFVNDGGSRGTLADRFDTDAECYGLYFENRLRIVPSVEVLAGGRLDRAMRGYDDRFAGNGDRSDERTFRAFSPKLGLLWRPLETLQVFANASRAYEPPLVLELASFGAAGGFLDLDAQDSWQLEAGTRGRRGEVQWDLAVFDAEIENEIVNVAVEPFPGASFTIPSYRNLQETRHRGLEVGLAATLAEDLGTPGASLIGRAAYTYSDFEITADPSFEGNDLPGAPRNLLRAALRYEHPAGFWVEPQLDRSASAYFVDSANTEVNDAYGVLGLRAGWDFATSSVFLEGRNLTDERYAASVQVDNELGRFFEPADGRSVTVGLSWRPRLERP
jgi:iron complex outermembrane receptor protein